jgi:pimeloyl-ACP methyl ester carboxylesterase
LDHRRPYPGRSTLARRLTFALMVGAILVGVADRAVGVQAAPDPLVVVLLQGWNTQLPPKTGEKPFAEIRASLSELNSKNKADQSVTFVDYSYTYPKTKYEFCDTDQSIRKSAKALDEQIKFELASRPNARLMLIGHSLGGVVESYWAAEVAAPDTLSHVRAIVTLDSPVNGLEPKSLTDPKSVQAKAAQLLYGAAEGCKVDFEPELNAKSASTVIPSVLKAGDRLRGYGELYNLDFTIRRR